jgi:uncharacterized protein
MDPRLSLLTLGVHDLAVSRRFYVDGLGWPPLLDLPEVVFVQIGPGLLLGLFGAGDLEADIAGPGATVPDGPGRFTLAHNVSSASEVDEAVARAVAAGAELLKAPQRAAFGGYHAYVADPDGVRWEIAHNPGFSVADDGTVTIVAVEPGVREVH